jgi:hypothetical protein
MKSVCSMMLTAAGGSTSSAIILIPFCPDLMIPPCRRDPLGISKTIRPGHAPAPCLSGRLGGQLTSISP